MWFFVDSPSSECVLHSIGFYGISSRRKKKEFNCPCDRWLTWLDKCSYSYLQLELLTVPGSHLVNDIAIDTIRVSIKVGKQLSIRYIGTGDLSAIASDAYNRARYICLLQHLDPWPPRSERCIAAFCICICIGQGDYRAGRSPRSTKCITSGRPASDITTGNDHRQLAR